MAEIAPTEKLKKKILSSLKIWRWSTQSSVIPHNAAPPSSRAILCRTGFDARGIKRKVLTRKIRNYFILLAQMVALAALKIMVIEDYLNSVSCYFRMHWWRRGMEEKSPWWHRRGCPTPGTQTWTPRPLPLIPCDISNSRLSTPGILAKFKLDDEIVPKVLIYFWSFNWDKHTHFLLRIVTNVPEFFQYFQLTPHLTHAALGQTNSIKI